MHIQKNGRGGVEVVNLQASGTRQTQNCTALISHEEPCNQGQGLNDQRAINHGRILVPSCTSGNKRMG